MDPLFGSVLSNHPTVRMIRFEKCAVPSRYIQMLAGGLNALNGMRPESQQWELDFSETHLDRSAVQAIAGALRRSAFHKLSLHDTGMTSPKCGILTGAAVECVGLTVLAVVEWWSGVLWAIDEEAFAPGSLSKLFLDECMWFGGSSWTAGGAAELFRKLRTNEHQVRISLINLAPDHMRFLEELLTTYNCTLNHLNVMVPSDEWSARIGIALGYGELARDARDHLEPTHYQADLRSLWPLLMGSMMTFPTLLYRVYATGQRGRVGRPGGAIRFRHETTPQVRPILPTAKAMAANRKVMDPGNDTYSTSQARLLVRSYTLS
jgi:hypothetical protein